MNEALPEGFVIGERYRVVRCIGVGGFGLTYLCEDEQLHRRAAVKEYFPRAWAQREDGYVMVKSSSVVEAFRFGLRSFLQEADILAQFADTPHIVDFYELLEMNDTAYLVMGYIDGISVGRRMRERGYLSYKPEEMAKILLPLLEGLGAMHAKSVIHSDISPGNIMCAKDGEVCLIDLGAAKVYGRRKPVLNAAFLKPEYAAPEQYQTAREGIAWNEGPWTDIYAAGGVMYYMLTGHKPADAVSRLSGEDTDLMDPEEYKIQLPGKWMELIRRAMALEIKERIQTADELSDRIHEIL